MCVDHPCSGTPDDIERLMALGLTHKLALDRFEIEEPDPYLPWQKRWRTIRVVIPAIVGHEFDINPRFGKCVFHNEQGLCDIHADKPIGGKLASCCRGAGLASKAHDEIIALWDSSKGKSIVKRFMDELRKSLESDYDDSRTNSKSP